MNKSKSLRCIRDKDLRDRYSILTKTHGINMRYASQQTILDILQQETAPRFYVTPHVAQVHVSNYRKGNVRSIRGEKLEMIKELDAVYERLRNTYRYLSKWQIWELVVIQEASSFYLTEHRMKEILFNYKGR